MNAVTLHYFGGYPDGVPHNLRVAAFIARRPSMVPRLDTEQGVALSPREVRSALDDLHVHGDRPTPTYVGS